MLLNDVIMSNNMLMTVDLKRRIIAAFNHFETEDQHYILDHLENFVSPSVSFLVPEINGAYPQPLIKFVNFININKPGKYHIYSFNASVEHPAGPKDNIIIGEDICCLYRMFQNEPSKHGEICRLAGRVTFNHPRDLFDTIRYISNNMDASYKTSIYRYVDWLLSISKVYDDIMMLSTSTIGLEDVYVMRTQAEAFNYLVKSARGHINMKYISEMASTEINIITSLIPVTELSEQKYTWRTLLMVLQEGNEDLRVQTVKFIHDRLNAMMNDPFRISAGGRFPKIKGIEILTSSSKQSIHKDIESLIRDTTREKIKDLIETYTGVVEELANITFDIPSKLLTMYQYEFAKENPIHLVYITDDMFIEEDGCKWRHIVYYGNESFIAFTLKDSPEKMYGIHINREGNVDKECNIIEFAGKKGANYTFLY